MKGKVIAQSGLRIRDKAGTQGTSVIGLLAYGTEVEFNEKDSVLGLEYTWHKISQGWIAGDWVRITEGSSLTTNTTRTKDEPDNKAYDTVNDVALQRMANENRKYTETTKTRVASTNLMGVAIPDFGFVHGLPYQFPDSADPRVTNANGKVDAYGGEYVSSYLASTPIVTFSPCTPKVLPTGFGKTIKEIFTGGKLKNSLIGAIATSDSSDSQIYTHLESMIGQKPMQYFTTQSSYRLYMDYVNTFCRVSAVAMGLGDTIYNGKKLRNYDWSKHNRDVYGNNSSGWFDAVRGVMGYENAVSFAFDPQSSISDSLSNSTTESVLAGKADGATAAMREAEFLLGVGAGTEFKYSSDEFLETIIPKMSDTSKYNPNSLFGRLKQMGGTIATGSSLRLPEIYSDSSRSPSYSLSMTFRAAYADPLSKYLDVLVPFWHIFCLGGPRMVNPNGYTSPFLIRAYSKGYFSSEMAIIDSISFTKFGDGEDISEDGVPMELNVDVSFRDLYNVFGMTKYTDINSFFANTSMLEFIGTMSGLNMSREDATWAISTLYDALYSNVTDIPGNFMEGLQEKARNNDIIRALLGDY